MTIRNKILFWFLLPTILVAIATALFCYWCTYKMADKNVSEAIVPIAHLRYIILIIGSTGIIVIVAVAVLISKKITASIDNAVEVARRIAKHDLENPIMNYKSMDDLSKPGKLINLELNKHRKENFHNNYSFSFTLPLTCAFNK